MAEVRNPLHVMAMRNVVSFIVWAVALSPLLYVRKGKSLLRSSTSFHEYQCPVPQITQHLSFRAKRRNLAVRLPRRLGSSQ